MLEDLEQNVGLVTFAVVFLPFLLVAFIEWWMVRVRPAWLARLAFLPIVPSRTVAVNETLLRAIRPAVEDAGYRDTATTRADVRFIEWPPVLEGESTKLVMPPGAGFGVAGASSLFDSRSSTSIARIGIRIDEGRATLSARVFPSMTAAYLFLVPFMLMGAMSAFWPVVEPWRFLPCALIWCVPVALVFALRLFWVHRRLRPSALWAMDEIERRLSMPDPSAG